MAEVNQIGIVDGVPVSGTGEVPTLAPITNATGAAADAIADAGGTGTLSAKLRRLTADLGALAALIDSGELEVKDAAAATALGSILAALEGGITVDTGLAGLATATGQGALLDALGSILDKLIASPATAANQVTMIGHVDGIETLIGGTNTRLDTLGGKDYATQTTLASLLAKVIAAPATEAKQDALIALVTTQNGYLDQLEGYVDGLEGLTGALTEAAPGTDTASSGLNGRLQRIAQRLTSLIALLPTALGQGTMAQSLKVAIASDQSAIPVVGSTSYVDVTLSLDTGIYAAGEVLADTQAVAGAVRVNAGTGVLQSITVIDQDDQKAQIKILLFSTNVSLGAENALPSISDTDAVQAIGAPIVVETTDYTDLGGASIAGKDNLGRVVKAGAGSTSLYVAVLNGAGTPTFTAAGIKLRLGFLQD